jgi:hypothetical protein
LQPGWEWVPARWVRLAQGWSYREGHWERVESDPAAPVAPRRHVVARPVPAPGPDGASVPDPPPPSDLAPLPEGDAGSTPTPTTPPPTVQPPSPPPAPWAPLFPLGPPITEINAPGVHIRVVPPVPVLGIGPSGYPGVIVPPVQVRVVRPLRGVRQMVRDILNGVLP